MSKTSRTPIRRTTASRPGSISPRYTPSRVDVLISRNGHYASPNSHKDAAIDPELLALDLDPAPSIEAHEVHDNGYGQEMLDGIGSDEDAEGSDEDAEGEAVDVGLEYEPWTVPMVRAYIWES
jgi:hypothetical protein